MSEASLPVNLRGPGLTLVYGWPSEERRAQGVPAAIQGIEFCTPAGKILPLDYCPWCGARIASSATSVRAGSSGGSARTEPAPTVVERAQPVEAKPEPAPSAPAPVHAPLHATNGVTPLKAVRERLGLSQAELAEKLGLARSTIANYENGRAPLSERIRKWIAKREEKLSQRA